MSKLLFVTTLSPYPDYSGGRQRSLNFILEMANNFQVTLLFPFDKFSGESVEFFEKRGIEVIVGLELRKNLFTYSDGYFRSYPFHFAPYIEAIENDYLRIYNDFDIIYIDHLHLSPLIELIKISKKKYYILDEHNVESLLLKSYYESFNGIKSFFGKIYVRNLELYEKKIIDKFSLVVTAGKTDRENLINFGGDPSKIKTVENGAYPPSMITRPSFENKILYVGTLNWEPNIFSIINYYKKVHIFLKKKIKKLELIIAGNSPAPKLLSYFKDKEDVKIIASFENVDKIYEASSLVIAPSMVRGGTKIKVVEAILHNRKIIATSFAAENLKNHPSLFISDDFKKWPEIMENILENVENITEYDQLKLSVYHWENIGKNFRDEVISCIG